MIKEITPQRVTQCNPLNSTKALNNSLTLLFYIKVLNNPLMQNGIFIQIIKEIVSQKEGWQNWTRHDTNLAGYGLKLNRFISYLG